MVQFVFDVMFLEKYFVIFQVIIMRRQVKEVRDIVQKQKVEIENFRIKFNMFVLKFTGIEKVLLEVLRDFKQEKDKFMKMFVEWNKKIRNFELQFKESSVKVES